MSTLKELFLDELADMYDAEKRISKALPKLAKAATSEELKEAFTSHLDETKEQITKLESVFESFGEKAKGKTCKATVGILEEGSEISEDNEDSPTLNAALIAAGQKVEHYEIASYTSLIEWARLLGNDAAVDALEEILTQEEAASEKLGGIAESSANEEAMSEDGEEDEGAEGVGKTKRKKVAKK
jgi:ferritin-like metal-binding protein YciE